MAKKTRKEKIIAEYRRKLTLNLASRDNAKSPSNGVVESQKIALPQTVSLQQLHQKNVHTDSLTLDPNEFATIKKDLIITLGLTVCILFGQFVLWRFVG